MKIKYEKQLLDPAVRVQIIQDIEGRENQIRKQNAFKRYQCYKDKTNHYVVEALLQQFDQSTVEEMRYALSNISIVKKVIDKLARVYNNGVERSISGKENETKTLKQLEKLLDVNTALKKTNRFLKLQKNVDLFVKPCPVYNFDGTQASWAVKLEALLPFLYDIVEDESDRTKALCVVLSDYTPVATSLSGIDGKRVALPNAGSVAPVTGDGKDQTIADNPADQKKFDSPTGEKTYVFWSKNLHFTCNVKGEIIADPKNPQNKNPLGIFNHINFSIDQDGAFWAEGGNDLIDGAILVNSLITHTNHVGTVQGYGQFYITGENLPRSIKVGPTKAIIAEYKKDEQAEPKMGFLNANPQLDSLRSLIEMYLALYLTTNNLSTSGVATQMGSANTMASGIALIIDKAESLEDVQDQRQVFIDKEPDIWEAINKILITYQSALVEELKGLKLPEDFKKDFSIKFNDPTPIMSEKEKLENMKLRQELGIDTLLSLIMKDDQSLDEEQAEEKLKKLIEQRIKEKMLEAEAMKEMGIEYDPTNEDQQDPTNEDPTMEDQEDPANQDPENTDPTSVDPNNTPTVGTTAGAPDQNVQQLALNGAQVTALVDMVEKVAAGTLPRDSAKNMIIVAFNVTDADAEKILSNAGQGFKIDKPEPVAQPNVKEDPNASDQQNN